MSDEILASLEIAEPPRITKYRIVAHDRANDLAVSVNQWIDKDWQPYGPPIFAHGAWYQTMVQRASTGAESDQ